MTSDNETIYPGTAVNFNCSMTINGQRIISANIVHMAIKEWIFDIVPRIDVILNDDGMLTEVYPIKDGSIIHIELNKNEQDTKNIIKLDFIILGHYFGTIANGKATQIVMSGVLNINEFYFPARHRSFKMMNSLKTLSEICKNNINSNNVKPSDIMTWYQLGINDMNMCKHIVKRAYVPDDAVLFYADSSGMFNYTTVKTIGSSPVNRIAKYDIEKFSSESFNENIDYNDIWFSYYSIHNYSTYSNIIRNYGISSKHYSSSDLEVIFNRSDINKFSLNKTGGVVSKNVHEKYYEAIVQNEYLINSTFSGYVLELGINPLSKPKLCENINAMIPSMYSSSTNPVLSGNYTIVGKVHEISKGEQYNLKLMCARNSYGTPLLKDQAPELKDRSSNILMT